MTNSAIFITIAVLALIAFAVGRQRSIVSAKGKISGLHSLPRHHGYFAASCTMIPALAIFTLWVVFGKDALETLMIAALPDETALLYQEQASLVMNRIRLVAENGTGHENDPAIIAAAAHFQSLYIKGIWASFSLSMAGGLSGLLVAVSRARKEFQARTHFEKILNVILVASSTLAVIVTLGIVLSLLFESIRFFNQVSLLDFLFGTKWSPQTALRSDQVGSSGSFGAVPLFVGTFLISLLAMLIAGPIGLFSAIYLTQYASKSVRKIGKPMLEILAGVPTVVYGFFAALTIAPFFRETGDFFGLAISSESALAAGFVMGIMIIPFVSSLSDDALTAVPNSLRDGSLALGATKSETITKVLIPAALPGIVGAFLLAVSRAIGETMIVVMAAGMQPNITANPFEAVTTVTVQIVALLTGDQEFDSAKTLSAFALGLTLFFLTIILNVGALRLVRKYREAYE